MRLVFHNTALLVNDNIRGQFDFEFVFPVGLLGVL